MSSTFLRLELLSDQSIGRVSRIENTDVRKSGAHLRLRDVGPAIPQKDSGPEHLAMPRPGCESAIRRPTRSGRIDQATSVARRRRCSIIASTPATSERALPPMAGSISGTAEGVAVPIVHPLLLVGLKTEPLKTCTLFMYAS